MGIVVDRIKKDQMVKILKKIIKNFNKKERLEEIESKILYYFHDNLWIDKKTKNILGFKLRDCSFCITGGIWETFSDEIQLPSTEKKSNYLYGILTYNKRSDVIFQILNKKEYIHAITLESKKSKRSEITGRVCNTYQLSTLRDIKKTLGDRNALKKNKKQQICIELEFLFRLKAREDPSKVWFHNEIH